MAVRRLTPVVMLANHSMILVVSGPSGRLSLMFVYFRRVGSCHTWPLNPPSSRCSSTTSTPRPSQLLKVPSSLLPMVTEK